MTDAKDEGPDRAKAIYDKLEEKSRPWAELSDFEQLIFSMSVEMVDLETRLEAVEARLEGK